MSYSALHAQQMLGDTLGIAQHQVGPLTEAVGLQFLQLEKYRVGMEYYSTCINAHPYSMKDCTELTQR